jgi:hypothetical protein
VRAVQIEEMGHMSRGGGFDRGGMEEVELWPNSRVERWSSVLRGCERWWGSESESQGGPRADNGFTLGKGEKRVSVAF